jgi:hypothetical protein
MATPEEMRKDRFFMMKFGRFIAELSYADKRSRRSSYYNRIGIGDKKATPWYENNFDWDQIADSFIQSGTKYSVQEIKAFFVEQQAAAKFEALLDED